jgi:hypothetical protein
MAAEISVYADLRQRIASRLSTEEGGDPKATAEAILRIVDAEDPPLRFIGGGVPPMAHSAYEGRLATWEAWQPVSQAAQGKRTGNTIASL